MLSKSRTLGEIFAVKYPASKRSVFGHLFYIGLHECDRTSAFICMDWGSPSCLYRGVVSHNRWRPVRHGFAYELAMVMVDVDVGVMCVLLRHLSVVRYVQRLEEAFSGLWPIAGVDRWGIISFWSRDHMRQASGAVGNSSLSDRVRDLVAAHTGRRPTGRIMLLTQPAYWGYCFNPVSFYYVYDGTGSHAHVETIIAEVSNTPW